MVVQPRLGDRVGDVPKFKTAIWKDVSTPDNEFLAHKSYCYGYDVYGEVLGQASFSEYILTLFLGNKPKPEQVYLFDCMAVAVANAGPRDIAVRAAMNSGVGGAPAAANLMSFLAVASGNYQGSHELVQLVNWFHEFDLDSGKWIEALKNPNSGRTREDIWDKFEHPPGFLPHAVHASNNTKNFLALKGRSESYPVIRWLSHNLDYFERSLGMALGINFVVAACFYQIGFCAEKAELCNLIMRLPGAAVHSLEAKQQGWKQFPFFGQQIELQNDPGEVGPLPDMSEILS